MPYRIRRRSDGLFSRGGTSAKSFNKSGKAWPTLGHVKLHLAQFSEGYKFRGDYRTVLPPSYADCEVVEYVEVENAARPVADVVKTMNEERKPKER